MVRSIFTILYTKHTISQFCLSIHVLYKILVWLFLDSSSFRGLNNHVFVISEYIYLISTHSYWLEGVLSQVRIGSSTPLTCYKRWLNFYGPSDETAKTKICNEHSYQCSNAVDTKQRLKFSSPSQQSWHLQMSAIISSMTKTIYIINEPLQIFLL